MKQPASPPKRLFDQVRDLLRRRHYALRTERAYLAWMRRFILFHDKRHPRDLGPDEIQAFLTHLAVDLNVAAATHAVPVPFRENQAYSAVLFLYRNLLGRELEGTIAAARARRPRRLPTVLSRDETHRVLACLSGPHHLMASLLYGSGLRLMECVRLRVKDLDFDQRQIVVRDGKGAKDRVTVLPEALLPSLRDHLIRARKLHEQDLADGYGTVHLPRALERKCPGASQEWAWHREACPPSAQRSADPRSGIIRRHHINPAPLQRAVKRAAHTAGINKPVTPHTFRHCFATHLLEAGYDTQHLPYEHRDHVRSGQVSVPSRTFSVTRMSRPR